MAEVTIEEQLDILLDSKLDIKAAINNNGGEITDETTFREYPDEIQKIINDTIVPYSDLVDTINIAVSINGEEV